MWFIFALTTFFAWGAADLFYKKGNENDEKYTHLKTSIVVGLVMGATAIVTMLTKGIDYDPKNLLIYLPVSFMYILSMTIGYFGLRYLELSISSPIQNASGAVSCILLILVLHKLPDTLSLIAVALITLGVVLLGVFEKDKNRKKEKGIIAFFFPIIYCIIDSLGTFFDGYYLDDINTTPLVNVTEDNFEDVANISYQFTFLIVAILLIIFLKIKREPLKPSAQKNRLFAAVFETAGQLTYVYALSGKAVIAAPVIASYCVGSVVLARIFLKEKLPAKEYISVFLVFLGIILLGIIEGISG